jgi:hypothetical protein
MKRMPAPVRAVLGALALVMAAFVLELAAGVLPADLRRAPRVERLRRSSRRVA